MAYMSKIRKFLPFLMLIFAFQLVGCDGKEQEQRKAFIEFLQGTILNGGVRLPTLSEAQQQKIGHYANDYNILLAFSQKNSQVIQTGLSPVFDIINNIKTPEDYYLKRDALLQASGMTGRVKQQIEQARQVADQAVAALQQPEDVKQVYQRVYEKTVTQPAEVLTASMPNINDLVVSLIDVGNFLKNQGNQVSYVDHRVSFPTQAQVDQYNGMMRQVDAHQQSVKSVVNTVNGYLIR